MKKIFDIFSTNQNLESNIDIEKLLKKNNLKFSDLDFDKKNSDPIQSLNKINAQINKSSNYFRNIKPFFPLFNYNAILKPAYTVILTTIVIFAVIEFKKINREVEYAEITVDAGDKITLHLNDDFTIWLNSESTIRVPMELKRRANIYLDGEAYFEIKNTNKISKIIANSLIFKVKQGAFNINSRNENNLLVSNIKRGIIEIINPNLPISTSITAGKGEKLTYNPKAEFISIEKENNINYLAWKTGILSFDNTSLKEVSNILTWFYNIPIQVSNPELENKNFTASFENADIDEILELLQITFNCEISGDGSKLVIN